ANGYLGGFVEDASFTKLREVALSLTLPQRYAMRVGAGSAILTFAGRNLHTWTNYTGVDPETSLLGSASPARGFDYFNSPQTRSYVFSLTLNR
ncbi:MAG: hypothetical protein ACJ8AQ_00960, partial [Gemmatimonadales bacterium]